MRRAVRASQAGKPGLPRGRGPLSRGELHHIFFASDGVASLTKSVVQVSLAAVGPVFANYRTMQLFRHPALTLILIGWHFLLAASGHGLHRLAGGEDRCADPATVSCGCSHPDVAACRSDSGRGTSRDGPFAAELGRAHGQHDSHACAICQWLTQHKSLPPAALTVVVARPLVELAERASLSPHRSCVCPYASRAPPGASSFA
jgi:hypothetical protein